METLIQFDKSLFNLINTNLSNPKLDGIMLFASGSFPWFVTLGSLLIWGLYWHGRFFLNFALASTLLISLTDIVAFRLVKPAFERLRPCYALNQVRLIAESCGGYFGFPSNHAANAMAVALFAWFCFRRKSLAWILAAFACCVGYSRVYLGVHYPFDVLGGFILGCVMALLVYFPLKRYFKYSHSN